MGENVGSIYYTVEADTSDLVNSSGAADKSLDRLQGSMRSTDKEAQRLGEGISKLASAIKVVIAASALREMANMVQKYQEMADRVRLASSSVEEFNAVQARLVTTANGTYRSLSEAQELYIRTADSLRSLGYTTAQAMDVQDSLSYAFVTNATSADRAGAAIDAFSKSINTGKVAADQWETISSAVPTVINQIAEASGKSASEVRALGAAGKLTATQLSEGLRKSLDDNAKAAAGMTNNLTDAGVRVRIAFTQVLVSLEEQTGVLDKVTNGIIAAADAMLSFGQDSGKMASFLQAATTAAAAWAAVIAGRVLSSMGAWLVAQGQAIVAFQQRTAAETAAAAAEMRRVSVEREAAAAAVQTAAAEYAAARGTNAQMIAQDALTAARARAAAAVTAYTAVQVRANAVASAGTVVMTGLRSALAFLGGPAGVILLAATAFTVFATNAKGAATEVQGLDTAVKDLTRSQAALQNLKIDEALGPLVEQAENARRLVQTMRTLTATMDPASERFASFNKTLVEQEANYEATSQKIREYMRRQEELKRVLSGSTAPKSSPTDNPVLTNPTSPGTGTDKAAAAAKKRAAEIKRGTLENEEAIGKLSQQLAQAGLKAQDLAEAQAVMSLNEYATPEQIAQVKALADALYKAEQAKANKQLLGQVDPIAGEQQQYEAQLENLKKLNEAKLLEDSRYLELKGQLEQDHADKMKALDEERFRQASVGNEMLMSTLDQVQKAGTDATVGLITGANNGTDAVQQLAGALLNEVVGALWQVGIAQVKSIIMGQAASAAATAQGVAQAGTLATAYAPAAAAASVASFGSAAVAGLSAMAAAIPAMIGLVSGGRQYGGGVNANGMYRINENGAPEVFNAANGRQYMLPNTRGEVVSNREAAGGSAGQAAPQINIYGAPEGTQVKSRVRDDQYIIDVVLGSMLTDGEIHQGFSGKYGMQTVGT
ncbi:tape measure protein [Pseudomonas denitrificans (nom. rej.)]|nr:tape measure protein [Pseudomonas denitrificans (nom. rej.)]